MGHHKHKHALKAIADQHLTLLNDNIELLKKQAALQQEKIAYLQAEYSVLQAENTHLEEQLARFAKLGLRLPEEVEEPMREMTKEEQEELLRGFRYAGQGQR